MNANELAEAMEIRASIRRQATSRKSVQENANDRLADQLEQAATMLRQQQTDLDIALSYMKQYELQIKQLQVAYEQEQYRSKQWQERFESGRLT